MMVSSLNRRMLWRGWRLIFWTMLGIYSGPAHGAATRPNRAYEDAAMRRDGSVARGREIFGDEQKGACVRCHTVDGSAGRAGPDLFTIGDKFPRRELIRSILEPSASIAIGYATTTLETRSHLINA
jgi:mono/diheme cytochrome c family protein